MLIPAAFTAKDVLNVEFDREDVAFIVLSLPYTMRTERSMRCTTLVWHLAAVLGLAAACTVRPSVVPERVLGFTHNIMCFVRD